MAVELTQAGSVSLSVEAKKEAPSCLQLFAPVCAGRGTLGLWKCWASLCGTAVE